MRNNAAPALGFLCIGMLIAIPIALLIGAVIFRAAVSLANKVIGSGSSRYDDYDDDYDDYDDEYDYPRPRRRYGRRSRSESAIPEPSIGHAMGIVVVSGLVNMVVGFVIGFVVGMVMVGGGGVGGAGGGGFGRGGPGMGAAQLVSQAISLPVGFLISSAISSAMLPTSFGRACLVTLFQYLLVLAIAVVIVVVLLGAGFALFQAGR